MGDQKYLGIDIGGSWIKATIANQGLLNNSRKLNFKNLPVIIIKSQLKADAYPGDLIAVLDECIASFQVKAEEIKGIGISTAGIVNYHGTKVLKAAAHLNVLKNDSWKKALENRLQCSASVINDADAAAIGLAEPGFLSGNKTVGIMPVGTGLGFSIWRNGRRWRPGKRFPLLGSIRTPSGSFDSIAGATRLAALNKNNNLIHVLTNNSFEKERELYFQNLAEVVNTATILYSLDEVIICGGLADAANSCNYPLEKILNDLLQESPVELEKPIKAVVAGEGNMLQLIGALALAENESIAVQNRVVHDYKTLETEVPYGKDIQLQNMETPDIIKTLWHAEQEAGSLLETSLPLISDVVDESVKRIKAGGRIIYVGAGTSGRIAAMDAVEIPCTYGFPEDRIIALVAGGISDAAIEIESDFEEDASAIPEMLLMSVQPEDIVFGISTSGTAYYVQSALAYAKNCGALSILIQSKIPETKLPFCDYVIPLYSGNEIVAGSTRMKAGTATKKVLNFLSSTIMIKMGKVAGAYMIDVACINNKLVERAQYILKILYGIEKEDALEKLKSTGMNLSQVINGIQSETGN